MNRPGRVVCRTRDSKHSADTEQLARERMRTHARGACHPVSMKLGRCPLRGDLRPDVPIVSALRFSDVVLLQSCSFFPMFLFSKRRVVPLFFQESTDSVKENNFHHCSA